MLDHRTELHSTAQQGPGPDGGPRGPTRARRGGPRFPPQPLGEEQVLLGVQGFVRGRKSLCVNYQLLHNQPPQNLAVLWVGLAQSEGCTLLGGWPGAGPSPRGVFHPPGGQVRLPGVVNVRALARHPQVPVCLMQWGDEVRTPGRCWSQGTTSVTVLQSRGKPGPSAHVSRVQLYVVGNPRARKAP